MIAFIVDNEGRRVNVDRIDFYKESYSGFVFARVGDNHHYFDMSLDKFEDFLAGIVTVYHLPEDTQQDAPVQDEVFVQPESMPNIGDQVRITDEGSTWRNYIGELVEVINKGVNGRYYHVRLNVNDMKTIVASVEKR